MRKNLSADRIHKKISDLVRNEGFKKDMNEYIKLDETFRHTNEETDSKMSNLVHEIFTKYDKLKKDYKKYLDKYTSNDIMLKICEKYNLNLYQFNLIHHTFLESLEQKYLDENLKDKYSLYQNCISLDINSLLFENLNPGDDFLPANSFLKSSIDSFPVAILINKNITQNELKKYISNHWQQIKALSGVYPGETIKQIRPNKKIPQEIKDFIYNNKNCKIKVLKEKLDAEFPMNELATHEISTYRNLEKNKRITN